MRVRKICITGGAGYVGSALIPKLLLENYEVTVLDTFWYGDVFSSYILNPRLKLIVGDIRNEEDLNKAFKEQDMVIHLACISNDPSFEMNPDLGKSINLDAFPKILKALKDCKVQKFVYASFFFCLRCSRLRARHRRSRV
jgi:nucleoside-diphosphate-sugar epimerase